MFNFNQYIKKVSIKAKLIILFVLIKIIPVLIISYIAINGVEFLEKYFAKNTTKLFNTNKKIIQNTADKAIDDSIKILDKKSQEALEKLSYEIAINISTFLYERDNDLLFLSKTDISQDIIEAFYQSKTSPIIEHEKYVYDETKSKWISSNLPKKESLEKPSATIIDNNREFQYTNPIKFLKKDIPIYKEIVFFDTKGQERYKVSSISKKKKDISKKKNTYIKAENYFKEISSLKKGEIYVSDVIGSYVKSNVIGAFTLEKVEKAQISFNPKEHGYAGVENPVGKKFDGIVRFITPVYKKNTKIGYMSLAVDHRHIMEFTDTINPTNSNIKQNIADASIGNYAFMWDYEGKNISHPRDYFIVGYDPKTGKKVSPWVSQDIQEKFEKSGETELIDFLKTYPKFEAQSLQKKPNLAQLKNEGNIALDCRYLNFAPQCSGWMEVTEKGGYGSFIIYWSNVWKLTTAAAIPYYTGKYQTSKRGFGFVTIGANVDEFHAAATQAKDNVNFILQQQTLNMEKSLKESSTNISSFVKRILNELTIMTFIMIVIVIFIAIFMSNYISSKIENLLIGTKKFSANDFNYKIHVSSHDEIGQLENSFNEMTSKISKLIHEQKDLNESLESKVKEAVLKTELNEKIIREKDSILAQQAKMVAMGEMLENIAHQWRQPLSIISTSSSALQMKSNLNMLKDGDIDKTVKNISSATKYLSDTIDDFRNFFSTDKEKKSFNIKDTIDKTLNIVSSKFVSYEIEIIQNIEEVEIYGYENELVQVLINLFNNAKDEHIKNNTKDKYIFIDIYKEEEFLIINIIDNASGIKEHIINRIFEPYFTTKHKSKGTGIGLHMSRDIITKHMNGYIYAQNSEYVYKDEKYTGAKFTIELPLKK